MSQSNQNIPLPKLISFLTLLNFISILTLFICGVMLFVEPIRDIVVNFWVTIAL